MTIERMQGLNQAFLELGALPNSARFEFADMLGRLGRDILAIQRARVARATGALAAALTSLLIVDENKIRLRVGLLGTEANSRGAKHRAAKAGHDDPRNLGTRFYGRIVEFGRQAQTVVVERRRRNEGQLRTEPGSRGRRKRVEDIVKTYTMKVTALPERPFVNVPDGQVDALVDQRASSFWERVLARSDAV